MRSIALGFAGGAWWLQQASSLPETAAMAWLAAACAGILTARHALDAVCTARRSTFLTLLLPPAIVTGTRCALLLLAAGLAGFDWAAWRAHQHARTAWPAAWEGRDVVLTGRIETMPIRVVAQAAWPGAQTRGRRGTPDWLVTLQVLQAVPAAHRSPRAADRADDGVDVARRPPTRGGGSEARGGASDRFTGRVQLRLRGIDATSTAAPQAGDVWQMVARLQRPHGLANFGLPMREARLFQHGIRASGSARSAVRLRPSAAREPDSRPAPGRRDPSIARLSVSGEQPRSFGYDGAANADADADADWDADDRWAAWRVRAFVERLRTRVGNRIDAVLEGEPHRGVVAALALGLQSAITPDDWTRFTQTGTNHLVAVSGLHIGLAAAVAAWCAGRLLHLIGGRSLSVGASRRGLGGVGVRRHPRRVRPLLMVLPRQRIVGGVAIVAAGAFVALSGFGIPAQRAFWMLSAYCLTSIDGRRVSPTVIWCLALWLVVLVDPWAVQSAGGWLSFTAIGAILYIASTIPRAVRPPRIGDDGVLRGETDDATRSSTTARFTMPVRPGEWRPLAAGDVTARLPTSTPTSTPTPTPTPTPTIFASSPCGALASIPPTPAPIPATACRRCRTVLSRCVTSIRRRTARLKRGFLVAARLQLALSLALAPASLAWFGETSVVGPLANLFAIPWVSFLAVPAVFCGLLLPAPLDAAAWRLAHGAVAWLHQGLGALIDGQSLLSAHLGVADMIRVPAPSLLALATACVGVVLFLAPRTTSAPGMPHWGRQCVAAALCLPVFCYRPEAPALGDFRVTMLDIGQGNGVMVETRTHRLLYDTGPPYVGDDNAGRRVIVPYLRREGIAALDGLIISHPHDDHYGGVFAVIDALPVRYLLASWPTEEGNVAMPRSTTASRRGAAALPPLWRHAGAHGIVRRRCRAGESWQWDGVRFETLWPMDPAMRAPPNHTSCVLRITNGRHAILLTGDIESPQEAALLRNGTGLRADVLLAPHHGSATSSTAAFIDAVAPHHVVYQAGFRNRHRHPNAHVVRRYTARGIAQYRSDADGAVRFTARGPALQVETMRGDRHRYWMTSATDVPRHRVQAAGGAMTGRAPVSRADRRRTKKQDAADARDDQGQLTQ